MNIDASARDRVQRLQRYLVDNRLDAFLVPSGDPHFSEYPPERYQCRAYLTGFTGSAGTAVVTRTDAALWTDSRYFLEADAALSGSGIVLMKEGFDETPTREQWLTNHLSAGATVGVDRMTASVEWFRTLENALGAHDINLVGADDPFDVIWPDRRPLPHDPLFVHSDAFAGETAESKLNRIRRRMNQTGADYHVVSTLDDVAWVLNLRGSDVVFNPVFVAYLVIAPAGGALFTDTSRVPQDVRHALAGINIQIAEYDSFWEHLPQIRGPVLVDPSRTSVAAYDRITAPRVEAPQPSTGFKVAKNHTELAHLRTTMVRDGVAMVRFLHELEEAVTGAALHAGGAALTERSVAALLHEHRSRQDRFVSDSFRYISGFGDHGAIVHYSVSAESDRVFVTPGIYLIDSGGQYLDGTTDITRTVTIGEPTPLAIEDFTLVLKAHIQLALVRFPAGTSGAQLDAIARSQLWKAGRTYLHGTGHGVGFFLNVHEGPIRINATSSTWPLAEGAVLSNEPGVYREGVHGIRIENLVTVQPDGETEFGRFLRFETLTLCPIDRRLIDPEILTDDERTWLNEYHRRVDSTLSPHLDQGDRGWLKAATAPI